MPKLRKRPSAGITSQVAAPQPFRDQMNKEEKIEHWWQGLEADSTTGTSFDGEDFGSYGSLHSGEATGADKIFFDGERLSTNTMSEQDGGTRAKIRNETKSAAGSQRHRSTPAARLQKKAKAIKLERIDGINQASAQTRLRIRSSYASQAKPDEPSGNLVIDTECLTDVRVVAVLPILGLFLFLLNPNRTLQLVLTILIYYEEFPPLLPNWTGLIPLLLPVQFQARLEVTLCFGMTAWLWKLDWNYAWRRVSRWIMDA